MVFPEYNEYYIRLGYVIQMLAYYIYYISSDSDKIKAIKKILKSIKSSRIIKDYEILFNKNLQLCDITITMNEKELQFRFDLTKDIREGLTFMQSSNVYFLDSTWVNYKEV